MIKLGDEVTGIIRRTEGESPRFSGTVVMCYTVTLEGIEVPMVKVEREDGTFAYAYATDCEADEIVKWNEDGSWITRSQVEAEVARTAAPRQPMVNTWPVLWIGVNASTNLFA